MAKWVRRRGGGDVAAVNEQVWEKKQKQKKTKKQKGERKVEWAEQPGGSASKQASIIRSAAAAI